MVLLLINDVNLILKLIPDLYRKSTITTNFLFSIQNECHDFYEATLPMLQNSVIMTRKGGKTALALIEEKDPFFFYIIIAVVLSPNSF